MLDLILVPTDFSDDAFAAIRLGAALARPHDSVVHLLHVDALPGGATEDEPPQGVKRPLWNAHVRERKAGLERLLAAVGETLGDDVRSQRSVVFDEISAAVLNQAQDLGAPLVIMGSHGVHSDRFLLGSVAAAVAVRAPCPVLITRHSQQPPRAPESRFRAPLLAVHDAPAARATAILRAIVAPRAPLDLLPAWPEASEEPRTVLEEKLAAIARAPSLERFETHPIFPNGRLGGALLDRLEAGSHDLVVLGTQTAEASARAGLGMLADRLIHRSPAPVLLLPGATAVEPD